MVRIALWVPAAAVLALAGLLFYADDLRRAREVTPPADLAPLGGRWADTGDARLFVQEWGPASGPLLLLVHGTGAWSGTWFELPETLAAAGWHVVAADLPPFGFSRTNAPSAAADVSRAAQARRLLALIDLLKGRSVTLVGHSFGAGPSLEVAMLAGDRLRRLVLIDPALGLGSNGEAPQCAPGGVAGALLSSHAVRMALIGGVVTQPRFTAALLSQFVFRKEAVSAARVFARRTGKAARPVAEPLARAWLAERALVGRHARSADRLLAEYEL
jgi:pimeloyl-ACP methyl ester carboxylesterase